MKTLDEVIKAHECCDHGEPDSNCDECPYGALGACCAERESDALYYLKEYRNSSEDLVKTFRHYTEEVKKYEQEGKDLASNLPLSWEQLKEMDHYILFGRKERE